MIQSFIHTTENNNFYIFDDQQRLSVLIHPEFLKAYEKSNDIDPYYLKKYEYLKEYGFFTNSKPANFENINEAMVRENFLQTPQITFEVTDSCNLNCTYCALGELYDGHDARNYNNINTQSAIKLLKYIFDLRPPNKNNKLIIGFYGGEPLLNFNFIKQIVELTNQLKSAKDIDIMFSMTTNATLIHKHIDFLFANKFRLLVSLDGNEKNHSYRVFSKNKKNSFQKVIENVDMIQRDYPEYFTEYLNFFSVLHDRNSVKEIYEFIYSRYHKIPGIAELALDDIKPGKKDILDSMFHSKGKSETQYQKEESNHMPHNELSSYKELTAFLKYCSINFYISNIPSLMSDLEKYIPTSTCLPFTKKVFLTSLNKLLPCEKISHKYSLGKVDNNIVMDISEITQKYNDYYNGFKKVCPSCYAYKFCGLCLFLINNLDKLGTEEFVCENFCDQKAFQNKLYRIFSFLEKYPYDFNQILENLMIEE